MRVIFISHEDYANFSYEKSESLKLMGVDAESYVLKRHPFGYINQAKLSTVEEISQRINEADLIHVMHSCGTMWDLVKHSEKRIIVWHTGTRYRQDADKHNERWNPIVEKCYYALGEFENLGCKNGEYFSVTIDTDSIPFLPSNNTTLQFAHYPSNAQVKGTQNITRAFSQLRSELKNRITQSISVKRRPFVEQMKRMSACDVYIEMCATSQEGKPYGSWGTTALESSAMGKPTITNFLWNDVYEKYYGKHELIIANSSHELKNKILELSHKSKDDILQMGMDARNWVIEKHGRKATGEKLIKDL